LSVSRICATWGLKTSRVRPSCLTLDHLANGSHKIARLLHQHLIIYLNNPDWGIRMHF
jgi:hypothetical protein